MAVAGCPVIYRVINAGSPLARALVWVFLVGFALARNGEAQQVTLTAPQSVVPGAEFEVGWQGPDAAGDFIAVGQSDAPPASFIGYARTSNGNPARLVAPAAGQYEIRYISGAGLEIMARVPLAVVDRAALDAPAAVVTGAEVAISVDDPGEPADYITIVSEGADQLAFGPFARLRGATQVTLVAPASPGVYEVRHIRARDQSIIARTALTVRKAEPSATADSASAVEQVKAAAVAAATPSETTTLAVEAAAGATTTGQQAGPEAATAEVEAAATTTGQVGAADEVEAAATQSASSGTETVEAAANAEVALSLMALVAVDRSSAFRVAWTGPGKDGDVIGIVPAGGGATEILHDRPATTSPVTLTAPDSPGNYDLVYIDRAAAVRARREIEVW